MDPPKPETVAQLTALAITLEERAVKRFRLMAERARAEAREDLADLFERLAEEEQDHAARVRELGGLPDADLPDLPALWPGGPGETPPAPDPAEIARLSPYACLAEAVRNEQTAFAFFSYVAAEVEDPEVKDLAESLAKEELQHAHLLRRARRRAYRRRRDPSWPKAAEVTTVAELDAAALRGEAPLLRLVGTRSSELDVFAEVEKTVMDALPGLSTRVDDTISATTGLPAPSSVEELLRTLLDKVQTAFEFYDAVADRATRQDVMLRAQALTAMSLERIKALSMALSEATSSVERP